MAHDRWPGRGIHATPVAVTGGTITPDINATLTTGLTVDTLAPVRPRTHRVVMGGTSVVNGVRRRPAAQSLLADRGQGTTVSQLDW